MFWLIGAGKVWANLDQFEKAENLIRRAMDLCERRDFQRKEQFLGNCKAVLAYCLDQGGGKEEDVTSMYTEVLK